MIQVSDRVREILKNDRLPREQSVKYLEIFFPELDLLIDYKKIVSESFELTERLCSGDELVFGSCEGSSASITVADILQELQEKRCIITLKILDPQDNETIYEVPLGSFVVTSVELENDKRFKKLTMKDDMHRFDIDVSSWYSSLTFPIKLKQLRLSLVQQFGLEHEEQALPNDDIDIYKTIDTNSLKGRDILSRICELHGGFGHFTRQGKFKVIGLSGLGLYPSEILYPREDLYPSEAGEVLGGNTTYPSYKYAIFEEYTVQAIDKLQINQESGDIGAIVGDGNNPYIITGNFLVFGKTAIELNTIANNVFLAIKDKYYRPHKTEMQGLAYMEVGDALSLVMSNDVIESFFFIRTLKGIQILTDIVEAKGKEKRENRVDIHTEITQLKGKSNVLSRTVEELSNTIADVEQGLESQISQTANSINQRVTDLDNDLQGQINTQAGQIDLKVSKNNVIASINLSPETARVAARNIQLEGITTVNSRFRILLDGSMEATGANISGRVSSYGLDGSSVIVDNGNVILNRGGYETQITPSYISTPEVSVSRITNLSTINGYIPITSQNIGQQSVLNANRAGLATEALTATLADTANNANLLGGIIRVSANNNLRSSSSGYSSCGTSDARWSSVWADNGTIQPSDERLKYDIIELSSDERFLKFARMIVPYTYKMLIGTSGRNHIGFIAQKIEESMNECNISSMEFAGLIKAPVYEIRLEDGEYDTSSPIVDYTYHLRYDEFVPLLFLWMQYIENKLTNL